MKIKAKEKAWYQNRLIEPGTVLNFEGKKLPKWAESLESKKTKKTEEKTRETTENNNLESGEENPQGENSENGQPQTLLEQNKEKKEQGNK